jgi:hypothetical protein
LEAGFELGPLSVAKSLFGWQLRASVGLLTALQKEDFLTRLFVPYMVNLMKQYSMHILVACVFERQVWTVIFHVLDLLPLARKLEDSRFSSRWCKTIKATPKEIRKGLNSLIILVAWELWKHRNACVFEGASPCVQRSIGMLVSLRVLVPVFKEFYL